MEDGDDSHVVNVKAENAFVSEVNTTFNSMKSEAQNISEPEKVFHENGISIFKNESTESKSQENNISFVDLDSDDTLDSFDNNQASSNEISTEKAGEIINQIFEDDSKPINITKIIIKLILHFAFIQTSSSSLNQIQISYYLYYHISALQKRYQSKKEKVHRPSPKWM